MTETVMLTLAYITDILVGDPQWAPHPVRAIGRAIEIAEQHLRKWFSDYADTGQKIAGIIMAISIPFLTYMIFYLLTTVLQRSGIHMAATVVIIYLTASSLATRELIRSAWSVIDATFNDDIQEARKRLSMIVGRDTADLDRIGILRAVIETLSENASDGIVAPMFYFAIGGLPLAMTYKAINTLDSMVGYKNDRYRNFGWASARLDDIANFIPARITGVLIVAATFIASLLGGSIRPNSSSRTQGLNSLNDLRASEAWKIMLRDGRKHSSPNSGVPEAAMAGALGVMLGGPSTYGGVPVNKPYIGEHRIQNTEYRTQNTEYRTQNTEYRTQNTEKVHLQAAGNAILLTKITSFLSLLGAVMILYIRNTLWI
jgi:adenosylcobinamide-phosphate synthase